jgi:RimJ/RimL family protein N-acetyltransferase
MPLVPLVTDRLELRALDEQDTAAVFGILGDTNTVAAGSRLAQRDLESVRAWIARRMREEREYGLSMWAIDLKDTREMIGLCGVFPEDASHDVELAYVVTARLWGNGYATEAVRAAVEAVTGVGRGVFATIRPWNSRSIRVAVRAGLHPDGEIDFNGRTLVYRMSPDLR